MTKEELLQNAIAQGLDYGYLSYDSLLDLCDEDMELVHWLESELMELFDNGEIGFELDL
jgi:hypothetical protein